MFGSYIVTEKCKSVSSDNHDFFKNYNNDESDEFDNLNIEYIDIKDDNQRGDGNGSSFNIDTDSLLCKKKKLKDLIKNLNHFELIEIFNIFKNENCNYSENTNGIFINITNVNEDIINKVYKFIEFTEEKKKELNDQETIIEIERERIKDINKLNEENYNNYIFNQNFVHQIQENKNMEVLSEQEEEFNYELNLSSCDEDENDENKFVNKKKKIKYTGAKARILKSYKELKEGTTMKNKKNINEKEKDAEEVC